MILHHVFLSFDRKTEYSEADTQTSPEHPRLCRTAPPLPELPDLPEEDRHVLYSFSHLYFLTVLILLICDTGYMWNLTFLNDAVYLVS